MNKKHIQRLSILLMAIVLASGCTPQETKTPVQENENQIEAAKEQADLVPEIDKEVYTYNSDKLNINIELPVMKIGDKVDINSTRILQKSYRDQINMAMTDADFWSVKDEAFTANTLKGGFEIVYEDDDVVSVKPMIEDNGWMSPVTLNKKTGTALRFEHLPEGSEFWSLMDEASKQAGMDGVSSDVRGQVFKNYYVTDTSLIFYIPQWYRGEDGKDKLEIKLADAGLAKSDILKGKTALVKVGSEQHVVSKPYYTFAGEVPTFESQEKPELAKTLSNLMETQIVMNQKVIEDDAKALSESNREAGYVYPPDIHTVQFDVMRNDDDYLSIYLTYYEYTGGAHGSHYDLVYNFDMATGERIELKDLFKADADYVALLNKEIQAQIEAIAKSNEEIRGEAFNPYTGFQSISDNQQFYITDDSIVVIFGLYEIAPYAAGIPSFEIPFEKLEGALK